MERAPKPTPLMVALLVAAAAFAGPRRGAAQPAPAPSQAQQPGASTVPLTPEPGTPEARAQAAFEEAMEAWRRGDCIAATERFERAMREVAHPHTRYNLARALECAGEVARAIEQYERFSAETADVADRAEVAQRLTTLRQRPVEVFVASEPLEASVRVDGEASASARTPCRLRLTPGAHVLWFERAGHRQEVRRVVVEPGVPQDVLVPLAPETPATPTPPPEDRVLSRRASRLFTGRASLLGGFAVPRDRPVLVAGVEAGAIFRRSLSVQAHIMWIDTTGAPMVVGGDIGWVFPLAEVDLGVYLTGSALLSCDTACREDTFRRDAEQFVGGFAVKADVVLHPRLAVGLFGRGAWRNFDLSNSEALLASGGLTLSLFL
jgi:hypothetical protein